MAGQNAGAMDASEEIQEMTAPAQPPRPAASPGPAAPARPPPRPCPACTSPPDHRTGRYPGSATASVRCRSRSPRQPRRRPGITPPSAPGTIRDRSVSAYLRRASSQLDSADHVRPILGCVDFQAVSNSYSWGRTDRSYMRRLREFRDQADDALHRQISVKPDMLSMDDMPSRAAVRRLLQECIDEL
jgi:hypothetical protein